MSKIVIVGDIYYADLYPGQGLPGPQPGGGHPSQPIYHPGHPDPGLPPHQGGHPSHPIYHPGHPDHGLPAYPDQGLPGGGQSGGRPSQPIYHPGHPDHGLPAYPDQGLPPGGEEIPPDGITDPELPEGYDDQLVIAVKKPGGDDWEYKAYDPNVGIDNSPPANPAQPDQGLPPTPAPTSRRGR